MQGYFVSPFLAYNFSELIESHAVDTYTEFAAANKELLQSLPPTPQVCGGTLEAVAAMCGRRMGTVPPMKVGSRERARARYTVGTQVAPTMHDACMDVRGSPVSPLVQRSVHAHAFLSPSCRSQGICETFHSSAENEIIYK